MKVILIEEARFAEVTELMRGAADRMRLERRPGLETPEVRELINALPKGTYEALVSDIHRAIHFEFVRWAQSHGASCVKQ